jgi:hypothetical protein
MVQLAGPKLHLGMDLLLSLLNIFVRYTALGILVLAPTAKRRDPLESPAT